MLRITHQSTSFHIEKLNAFKEEAIKAQQLLQSRKGPGNDFLGWLDLPKRVEGNILESVDQAAQRIRSQSEVLVVIGIGGSYLGAKAALDFLAHQHSGVEIVFAGHHMSSLALQQAMDRIQGKDFSINVISKSGTTTEPAIAFRLFRKLIEDRYGKAEASQRIYATTDGEKGALRTLADQEGYTSFIVPDDVGGRYSVLSPVGLLPMAAAGIDIQSMIDGAALARTHFFNNEDHVALEYVALRNYAYANGKKIELFASYEPALTALGQWWQQLYGESEGKDGKGIFPAVVSFSTDLHAMGQYIQDGERHMMETQVVLKNAPVQIEIPYDEANLDGLNYLKGKTLHDVNTSAFQGTLEAHEAGGVPNICIELDRADASVLGYTFYFFEYACAVSGYLLGVNPFDQPGVEAYKRNMFRLLGKPGI